MELALSIVNLIKSGLRKDDSLSIIAGELAKAGKIEQALDAAKTIQVANMQGVWLSTIARNLAKAGNIEQALDAAKYIGSPKERRLRAFLDISINLKLMSPPMNTKREPEGAQKILNLAFSK